MSNLQNKLEFDFFHSPPNGYFYSFEEFKKNVIRIWLNNTQVFVYNGGKPTKTVWGFYNSKKNEYYSPINSSKVGEKVDIKDTRDYTAMQIQQTPLEKCFI
jgi:hypothetical protein